MLSSTAWTTAATVLPTLTTLALSVTLTRFLGPRDFGRQTLIAFLALSASTVFAARVPMALARFGSELLGARQPGKLRMLFRWALRVQAVCGVAAVTAFTVAAAVGADPGAAWVLAGAATGIGILQSAPSSLLIAGQRWRESVGPGIVISVASVAVVVLVLALGGGITGYFAVEVGVVIANLVWTTVLARRFLGRIAPAVPLDDELVRERRRFLRASTFFAVTQFVVLTRSEVVFLAHFSGPAQVGFYSVAFAAASAVGRLPTALTNVAIPALSTLRGAGEQDRIRLGYWRAVRLLLTLAPIGIALACPLGVGLVSVAYGTSFNPARPVLAIMLVPYLVLPIAGLADALLWIEGRMRFLVVWGGAAVIVNLGLALVLIPVLDALGAAIVNDAAQLVAGLPAVVLVTRLLGPALVEPGRLLRTAGVAAAVAAAAAAPVFLAGGLPGVLEGTALAALVLFVLVPRAGLISAEDAAWLRDSLGDRVRPVSAVLRWATTPAGA